MDLIIDLDLYYYYYYFIHTTLSLLMMTGLLYLKIWWLDVLVIAEFQTVLHISIYYPFVSSINTTLSLLIQYIGFFRNVLVLIELKNMMISRVLMTTEFQIETLFYSMGEERAWSSHVLGLSHCPIYYLMEIGKINRSHSKLMPNLSCNI